MTFSIYALLPPSSPIISSEWLEREFRSHFKDERDFSIRADRLPFASHDSLSLRWGEWLARVSYEDGEEVLEESQEVKKIIGPAAPEEISAADRRIRVVFDDDKNREYTNQIIYILDFLGEIPGVVIFDNQRGDLIE